MHLSEEQVLALAPDEASKKAGKALASPSPWTSKGVSDRALWGECQGSGSKPYQTQVDLSNIAFKCSCPSRKFPCKHGLGLLLLYARQQSTFTDSKEPAWVTDWIEKRTAREEKKTSEEAKPIDEAAQAKRQQARQQKVSSGMEELQRWMKDMVRNGIHTLPEKGPGWFENMIKRMVDAQAPGLANMLRNLAETSFYAESWQHPFMDQLISLYLLTQGYHHIQSLPERLQQDIRTAIGFTQNQETLKAQEGITDTWLVLEKQSIEIDNITTERYWLYGTASRQYALVLQFVVRGQGSQLTLTPGLLVTAELVFYPSQLPMRALIKQQLATGEMQSVTGLPGWLQVAETESEASCRRPFRGERPYIIQQLTPVQYNNEWWLQDSQHNMMQMKNVHKKIWKLLSLSGGKALDTAVIGRETAWEPVGVWHHQQYTSLS